MIRLRSFVVSGVFGLAVLGAAAETTDRSGHVQVGEVKVHFESHGAGDPLLLLHGGLSSSRDFAASVPRLSEHFRVVLLDRRGHGRSGDTPAPFSYADMGQETAAALDALGLGSVFVMGWSDGAVVGFHLASAYPDRVRRLVAVGANIRPGGLTAEDIERIKTRLTPQTLDRDYPSVRASYLSQSPNPQNYDSFLARTRELWLRDPYISEEDFRRIQAPVLLAVGDRDSISLEHTGQMFAWLKTARLFILPNADHFVFDKNRDLMLSVAIDFLKEK